MAKQANKPVKVFRLRGLSASIFENHAQGKNGAFTYPSVSLQRTYKDGNEFKNSTSLRRDDLPVARHLLQKAWEFILESPATRDEATADES